MTQIVDWKVKHQYKQTKHMDVNQSIRWSDVTNSGRHTIEISLTRWQTRQQKITLLAWLQEQTGLHLPPLTLLKWWHKQQLIILRSWDITKTCRSSMHWRRINVEQAMFQPCMFAGLYSGRGLSSDYVSWEHFFFLSIVIFYSLKPENIDWQRKTPQTRLTYNVKTDGKADASISLYMCADSSRYLITCKYIIQRDYYSNVVRAMS